MVIINLPFGGLFFLEQTARKLTRRRVMTLKLIPGSFPVSLSSPRDGKASEEPRNKLRGIEEPFIRLAHSEVLSDLDDQRLTFDPVFYRRFHPFHCGLLASSMDQFSSLVSLPNPAHQSRILHPDVRGKLLARHSAPGICPQDFIPFLLWRSHPPCCIHFQNFARTLCNRHCGKVRHFHRFLLDAVEVTLTLNARTCALLHLAEGRSQESPDAIFAKLTDEQKATILAVAFDRGNDGSA